MTTSYNASLPPFPTTGTFTADWKTQPIQQYVYKLALSPGSYEISVLPDLLVLTTAAGTPTPDDINYFTEEALISRAYIVRTVNYYDERGLYYSGQGQVATLLSTADTLAAQAMEGAGYFSNYGAFDFYDTTVAIEAERSTSSGTSRTVYTSEYYLYVEGWNYSYPHQPEGTETSLSGRFLVTTGNPTGQRTQTWGGEWLNVQSLYTYYSPPVTPPSSGDTGGSGDIDPRTATGSTAWVATSDGNGFKTLPHRDDLGTWYVSGDAAKNYFANAFEYVLSSLETFATQHNYTTLLGAIDCYRRIKSAYDLYGQYQENYQFLRDHNSDFLMHAKSGFDLIVNPNATMADAEAYFAKLFTLANQYATDSTRLAVKQIPGGETLLKVYDAIKYVAQHENSVSFSIYAPDVSIQGPDKSEAIIGGNGDDAIQTGTARDIVYSGDGADTVASGGADDWLQGGASNDILDGGSGKDAAFYSGARTNYTVAGTIGGRTVTDNAGAEGSDTLTNIERLKFADGILALDTGSGEVAGETYRIYKAAFNRTPDAGGLSYWIGVMDTGASLTAIAGGFMGSLEFKSLYGSDPSNADLLTRIYNNILGRAPDLGGYQFWLDHLNANHLSREELLANFSESPENQAAVVGVIQDGIWYT